MSAEVAWSVVRKAANYTKKQNNTVFSFQSVDGFHRQQTAKFGRRRSVDVTKGGKLIKIDDGKKTVHRYNTKRAAKLLDGFRGDLMNKASKKVRFTKMVRGRKAAGYSTKKAKKVKA
jgi:hypothetical protein